jgi:hypothetical protein
MCHSAPSSPYSHSSILKHRITIESQEITPQHRVDFNLRLCCPLLLAAALESTSFMHHQARWTNFKV